MFLQMPTYLLSTFIDLLGSKYLWMIREVNKKINTLNCEQKLIDSLSEELRTQLNLKPVYCQKVYKPDETVKI